MAARRPRSPGGRGGIRRLPEAWRRELVTGLTCMRAGDLDRAGQCFERAHAHAPGRPEVCLALGSERMRRGRVEEAEPLLAAAFAGDPSFAPAAAALARCRGVHQHRFAEAHAILDQAAAAGCDAPSLAVIRGEVLLEEDRPAEARRALARVLTAASTVEAARACLSRVCNREGLDLVAAGDLETALFSFKQAADFDPAWAAPHVNLGAAFVRLGNRRRGRVALERAVAIDPDNPVGLFDLGSLCRELGDAAGARRTLERLVAVAPDYPGARASLAEVLLEAGDAGGAVALCAEDLERDRGDAARWFNLGVASAAAGDPEHAETCLRTALELAPEHVGACCRLADLVARDGRYLEAAALAQRAEAIDPARAAAFRVGRAPSPRRGPR